MKSNALLKWLVIPVLFIVIFIVAKTLTSNKETESNTDIAPRLTAEEMKALGIEGDTPRDTLATLVGQVKQLRQELQDTRLNYQDQKVQNERLSARESNIDQKINSVFNSEKERLRQEQQRNAKEQQQTSKLLGELQNRISSLGNKPSVDLPIGLGLETAQTVPETVIWVEPSDVKPTPDLRNQNAGNPFATSFNRSNSEDKSLFAGQKIRHENYAEKNDSLTPVYTIPANSTLMGSVAMTALIGRVPVDGTVNDPYPFKVLVGPDNLTANGIDLPDVVGAVLSGSASGDWTLSCVRGQITSMTFVFNDGTIRTVPKPATGESTQNKNNRNATAGGLGWISDPYGIPCVSGERKSNAAEYIGNQSLITAAGAGVAYLLRDSDNNTYSNGGDVTTSTDAVGQILQGGVKDISTWMNKLYGEAFAAVYVKPGAKVAVHLDQELAIDFDEQGRRVDYKNNGGTHALSLD